MSSQALRGNPVASTALLGFAVVLSAAAAQHTPAAAQAAGAKELVLTVDPAQSTVHYTVGSSLHTVHGTFALKRGTLRLEPASGKANGEIVVDAASGQSGNSSRDKKMHKEVLESSRFTEIIFRPDRVEGAIQPQGSSSTQLHGVCVLHGGEHEITVPVHAELKSNQWKGTATFSVPYDTWGLKNPGNFLLKVDHTVSIDVEMAGSIAAQVSEAKP
jgi:polyisoprenoid-binding protein YceI